MAKVEKEYMRLPGGGMKRGSAGFFAVTRSYCRLWLAKDHLLLVDSEGGYSETYKRFYFRDIQAFILRKTKGWAVGNGILATITGLFLVFGLSVSDVDGRIALLVIAAIFGLILLANVLFGPTCTCHLKTAVHLEELPSLRRLRRARKVLARLKPLVNGAQGELLQEQLAAQLSAAMEAANVQPAVAGQSGHAFLTRAVRPYRSNAHKVLFIALIADAVMSLVHIALPSLAVILISMIVGITATISLLIGLVRQSDSDLKAAVRYVTWTAAVFTGINYLVGYMVMIILIPARNLDGTQWEYIKALSEIQPLTTPWMLALLIFNTVVSATLGLAGIMFLRKHWAEKSAVPPAPPVISAPENSPPVDVSPP
jgi:hypothetical protein